MLDRYFRIGNFLNLVHAKARWALTESTSPVL